MISEKKRKDFRFKLALKVKVYNNRPSTDPGPLAKQRTSLLAVANQFGLIFAATDDGFKVYNSKEIYSRTRNNDQVNDEVTDLPEHASLRLSRAPCHLSVSADNLTLSVVVDSNGFPFAFMYDVRAFAQHNAQPSPFVSIRLGMTANVVLNDFAWNPSVDFAGMCAACMSDGSVSLWQVNDSAFTAIASISSAAHATCLCWSPKGKQLLIGQTDGRLTQLDQTLKPKKQVDVPAVVGSPMCIVDVLWESTHAFFVAFLPPNASTSDQPMVALINSPKTGGATSVMFEDICYGGGEDRCPKYFMSILNEWDMIVSLSANALESAVLGRAQDNRANWERWSLEDAGRAEIPLSQDFSERFPVGMAIETTFQDAIALNETQKMAPVPSLLLLSSDGLLICWHMMFTRPGVPSLVKPSLPIPTEGERKNPQSAIAPVPSQPAPTQPAPTQPAPTQPAPTQPTLNQATPSAARSLFGDASKPTSAVSSSVMPGSTFSFGAAASTASPSSAKISLNFGQPSRQPTSADPPKFGFAAKPPVAALPAFSKPSVGILGAKPQSTAPVASSAAKTESAKAPLTQKTSLGFPTNEPPAATKALLAPPPAHGATAQTKPSSAAAKPAAEQPPPPAVCNPDVDNHFLQSIKEEMNHFQNELNDLKSRCASVNFDVGTKAEQQQLRRGSDLLQHSDLQSSMHSLNENIHHSRLDCLEAFSTLEECQLRNRQQMTPSYQELLRQRGLDPQNERKLDKIRSQFQFIQSGIREVDFKLDADWEQYQRNKNKRTLKTPDTENIYQTLSNNQRILHQQSRNLQHLTQALKQIKLDNSSVTWSDSVLNWQPYSPSLSKLTSALKNTTLRDAEQSPSAPSPISPEKVAKLREALSRRRATPVKSCTPENLSMSKIVAAESLRRILMSERSFTETPEKSPRATIKLRERSPVKAPVAAVATVVKAPPTKSLEPKNFTSVVPPNSTSVIALSPKSSPASSMAILPPISSMATPSFSFAKDAAPTNLQTSAFSIGKKTAFAKAAEVLRPSPGPPAAFNFNSGATSLGSSAFTMKGKEQPSVPCSSAVAMTFGSLLSSKPNVTTGALQGLLTEDITPPSSPKEPEKNRSETPKKDGSAFTLKGDSSKAPGLSFGQSSSLLGSTPSEKSAFKVPSPKSESTEETSPEVLATPLSFDDKKGSLPEQPSSLFASSAAKFSFGGGKEDTAPPPYSAAKSTPLSLASSLKTTEAKASETGVSSTSVPFSFASSKEAASGGFSLSSKASASEASAFPAGVPAPSSSAASFSVATCTASAPSAFGVTASSSLSFASKPSGSAFGGSGASSVLGGLLSSTSAPPSSQASASQEASASKSEATPSSVFGSIATAQPASSAGSVATSTSAPQATFSFASGSSQPASSVASAFGSSQPTSTAGSAQPASAASTFGSTPPTASKASAFSSAKPASTTGSAFGSSSAQPASSATSPFGGSSAQPASTAGSATSVFGSSSAQPASTAGSATSPFGGSSAQPASTAGSATSVFGGSSAQPASTAGSATSAFGGSSAQPASTAGSATSAFGGSSAQPTSTVGSATSVFGGSSAQPASTAGSATSVFGGSSAQPASTASSVISAFGGSSAQPASTVGSTTSVFGGSSAQPASTAGSATSVFGSTQPASTATSLFGSSSGQPQSSASGTSVFGSSSSSSSAFGGSVQTSTSAFGQSSPFNQAATTSATFGSQPASSALSVFGQPSKSTFGESSAFGQASSPAAGGGSVFGGGTGSGQSSVFGQSTSSGSLFGGGSSAPFDASGSGAFMSGLGSKPTADQNNKNVFGATTFGSTANGSTSLFGGNSSEFNAAKTQANLSGGAFTSGAGVASQGFGGFQSPQQQQQQQQASPAFGGAPAFGGTAAFGSPPAFGGVAAMGGSSVSSGAGFAAFSGGASLTFGSLAQQADTPTFGGAGGGTGAGGGSAFGGFAPQSSSGSVFGGNSNSSFSQQGSSFTSYRS